MLLNDEAGKSAQSAGLTLLDICAVKDSEQHQETLLVLMCHSINLGQHSAILMCYLSALGKKLFNKKNGGVNDPAV